MGDAADTTRRRRQAFFKETSEAAPGAIQNSQPSPLGQMPDKTPPTTAEGDNISLRDYIAERVRQGGASTTEAPGASSFPVASSATDATPVVPPPTPFVLNREAYQLGPQWGAHRGQQLNGLDTELTSGIEHLLPTPSVRFRVIKERLLKEITDLEAKLARMKAIRQPSKDVQEKAQLLEKRLHTLRLHEAEIDQSLAEQVAQGGWLFQIAAAVGGTMENLGKNSQKASAQAMRALAPEVFIRKLNRAHEALAEMNQDLQALNVALEDQMLQRGAMPAAEISDIINQYDRTLLQMETMAEKLRQRGSIVGWVKRRFEKSKTSV